MPPSKFVCPPKYALWIAWPRRFYSFFSFLLPHRELLAAKKTELDETLLE